MAVQIGTVDGLVNITEEKIRCMVNAIHDFSNGGVQYARNNDVSFGAAFQRFVDPVYSKKQQDFRLADILTPVYTKGGKEQSPARGTFCRKMGLLNIDDQNDVFELTPLAWELYEERITIEEYAFILLTKQGIFKDGVYIQNLFAFIAEWFDTNPTITEAQLRAHICKWLNDDTIEKTRTDIIINALAMCGLVSNVGPGIFVLSNLKFADIFRDFKNNQQFLSISLRDDEAKYTEYIGSMKYGIFDILTPSNLDIYKDKYPHLARYIQTRHQTMNNIQNDVFNTDLANSKYRHIITAIKSKPFLLLAGISGTGKSRIVRELARACWDVNSDEYRAQKPSNFEMIQVKPNWHDSSELIGYVSRANGVCYVVGPFLKFLTKAIQNPLVPHFLCLDEMNLAPVEQYFAEYLSVIESRKTQMDGTVISDPIIDYSDTQEYHDLIAQLFDDPEKNEYLRKDGGKRLRIPQNLIIVGTVNMDETTFSFSRKVLDRAMTIEMNEVNLEGGVTDRHEKIGKLSNAELLGSAVEAVDIYESNKSVCDIALLYLKAVNNRLEGTPFKIAYRTRNEVLLYVVNNLPYNKDADGSDLDEKYVIARAFDEITNMKILSRIEGDETKVSAKFLESLEKTIKDGLEEISTEHFAKEESDNAHKSISLAKLDEMKTRLASGYTSFWS